MLPDSPSPKIERACPRCGLVYFSDKIDAMCPACLISNTLEGEDVDDGPAFWEEPPVKKASPARTFSHFELLDELGRGGMGVVYRARDLNTERIVALKVLQAHHLDVPDLVLRFRSEVRAVSSLDHAYVLPIHEVGEYEGIPFFSMKLTTGGSLAQSLGNFRNKPREAAQLLAKVARGVQHAHERGILHRDLKPGNILLDAAGEPYVCDFGLAKWIEDDQKLTVTAAVLGTPHYIAPEQALGSKALTTAVDIYSLGAILYELLTGRPPFLGATVLETLVASQEKIPDRPSSIAKNVPADLETICLKALEHSPGSRYATAGAFADDLENWLAGRPINARPVNAAEQLWRWAKRNPLPALLVAALLGTLLIVAVGSTLAAARFNKERQRAVAAEGDAKKKLHFSLIAQARALVTGKVGQRVEALAALRQAAQIHPSLDVRNEAIAALSLLDMYLERVWTVRQRSRVQPVFDANLNHVAAEAAPGIVRITRIVDNITIAEFSEPIESGEVESIKLWKLQRLAVRYTGGRVVMWDIPSRAKLFSKNSDIPVNRLPWLAYDSAFSPDGKQFYVPSRGGLSAYDSENGNSVNLYNLAAKPSSLAFSPSGRYIAVTFTELAHVSIIDVKSKEELATIKLPVSAWNVSWHPDDEQIAIACRDFNIYLANAKAGRITGQFSGHRQEVTHVRFSNSGDLLASTSRDNTLRLWSLKSHSQEVLAPGYGGMPALYFSSDDSHLAAGTGDTRACIFEITGRDRVCQTIASQTIMQRAMLVSSVDYSPDHSLLLSVSYENVEIFDARKGIRLLSAQIDPNAYKAARFIDNKTLIISSELSGVAVYKFSMPDGAPQLKIERIVREDPGFTLGSIDGQLGRLLPCFDRLNGRVDILNIESGSIASLSDDKPNVKDVLLCATRDLAIITFFESSSRSAIDTDLWSISRKKRIKSLPSGPGSRAVISPNGKWIATTSIKGCMIWDTQDGHLLRHFPSFGFTLTFSPDSSILAVSENEDIMIIDTNSFEVVSQLRPPVFPSADHRLCFSSDGSMLAAQGADGTIRQWNFAQILQELSQLGLSWRK